MCACVEERERSDRGLEDERNSLQLVTTSCICYLGITSFFRDKEHLDRVAKRYQDGESQDNMKVNIRVRTHIEQYESDYVLWFVFSLFLFHGTDPHFAGYRPTLRRCGKQNHGFQGLLRLLCKGKRFE